MQPQSGVNLGTAYGDIVISDNIDKALDSATRSFDNALSRIGNSISNIGSTMTNVGGTIQMAMTPLELMFAKGLNVASDYSDALTEIQARAGLTADELAMVSEKALELGADSAFSAQQASDAFLQLLTSGSSLEEAMVQIDAVIAGASANGTELGFTADALTDVMAAFSLEAEHSAEVMQTLTNATGASSATFSDLVQGFANVGPVAANFGMSIEETAATLAVFSENGIKGAEAGTQLKSMLSNMARDTEDVTGMWEQLGVSLYDAQGNMRDLDSVIDDLNVAMAGMSDEERNNAILTLAGSHGQVGLSALLAAGGIDEMTASMEEQASMEDLAASRMDTFSGAVDSAMGSLETLAIRVMTPFMNKVLKPTIQYITTLINQISDWAAANEPLVMTILGIVTAMFTLGPILIGLGLAIQLIGGAIAGLGVLFGILLSPIGLIVAAVAALAYIFRDDLGAALSRVMEGVQLFFDLLGSGVSIFEAFQTSVASIFEGIDWTYIGTTILDAFGSALSTLGGWATWAYDNLLVPMFNSAVTAIGSVNWAQIGTNILSTLGSMLSTLGVWATWAYDNLLMPIFNSAVAAVSTIDWALVGTTILNALGTVLSTLGSWATWVYTNLLMPMVNSITTAVSTVDWALVGTTILTAFGSILSTLGEWASWAYDNLLVPLFNSAITGIANVDWYQVGYDVVMAIGEGLKTLFDFTAWIIDSIYNPVLANTDAATGQVDWFAVGESVLNAIGAAVIAGYNFVMWLGENIFGPLLAGVSAAIGDFDWSSVGTSLMDAIGNAFPDVSQWVQANIIGPIQSALSGFNPMAAFSAPAPTGVSPSYNSPSIGGKGSFGGLMDSGGQGYPGMSYLIGTGAQPELFIPDTAGTFVPNADMAGERNYFINIENISAANAQEAAALGNSFGDAFMNKLRNSGYAEDY
jgi:TP901 family phage tail tape measure protein